MQWSLFETHTNTHSIDSIAQGKDHSSFVCLQQTSSTISSANTKFRVWKTCCIVFMKQFYTHKCLYTQLNCHNLLLLLSEQRPADWNRNVCMPLYELENENNKSGGTGKKTQDNQWKRCSHISSEHLLHNHSYINCINLLHEINSIRIKVSGLHAAHFYNNSFFLRFCAFFWKEMYRNFSLGKKKSR